MRTSTVKQILTNVNVDDVNFGEYTVDVYVVSVRILRPL